MIIFLFTGMVILCLLAYVFRNWRRLAEVVSLMGLPLLLLYFVLPESPRWLQDKGRLKEANAVMKKITEGCCSSFQ